MTATRMERRPAAGLAVLALMGAACAATGTEPPATTTAPASLITTSAATTAPANPSDALGAAATVVDVLDGDSLRVLFDGEQQEVRLLGINAPERDECHADAARGALTGLVDGTQVRLLPAGRDQFDRILAVVLADGRDVGSELLAQGAALAVTGDHEGWTDYLAAEQGARAAQAGIWDPAACGEPTETGVAVLSVEADPPGRDADSEAVILVNEGDDADVGGWVLRDESSVHRFELPPGTVIPAGGTLEIRTGCGTDGGGKVHWCAGEAIWNNDGDTALLLDPNGNIVSSLRY